MPRTSSLTVATSQILAHFAESGPRVYTEAELAGLLMTEMDTWRLVKSTRFSKFIALLQHRGDLQKHVFEATAYGRQITRYAWGPVSAHAIATSLNSQGYLSHGTAANLHKLTKTKLDTIYLNVEQSPKPAPKGRLTQAGLDRAFANRQRQSNYVFREGPHSITIIAGKNSNQLGIAQLEDSNHVPLNVTNLERTLIDITVRPAYAGGIGEVLNAYGVARDHISLDRLLSTLEKLAYVYPYHQAIGFLMQAAGYDDSKLLRALPRDFDFYLSHGMKDPRYSKNWRVYYPRDLRLPQ